MATKCHAYLDPIPPDYEIRHCAHDAQYEVSGGFMLCAYHLGHALQCGAMFDVIEKISLKGEKGEGGDNRIREL